MPQLDLSLYFSSWFFTFITFLVLYLIVYNYFLPNLITLFKTRTFLNDGSNKLYK